MDELEVTVRFEDRMALYLHRYDVSPIFRRVRIGFLVFGVVLLLAVSVVMALWWAHEPSMILIGIGASVFLVLTAPRFWRNRFPRTAHRMLTKKKDSSIPKKVRYRSEPDGLSIKSETAEAKVYWKTIERIDMTPTHAFIYFGMDSPMVLPRATASQGDYDRFLAGVRAKMSKPPESSEVKS